jgi:hypothetical protein
MDELSVIGRARRLVGQLTSAPIDVIALASSQGFEVRESDQLASGEAGNTFSKGGKTYIVVNKNDDPYRRRFTVLHEIAHHLLGLPSNHGAKIPSSELERFSGRPIEERLCDVFAAECLVPSHLLRPLVSETAFSVDSLHRLSDHFQASRPCIASSFARASTELVAYVFAEAGRVQSVIPSSSVREQRIFIQSGVALPSTSAAARCLANGTTFETADLDATDWSSSDAADAFACNEEALHLRAWKQTLSLITFEQVGRPRSLMRETDESEELLAELTGHLPWPKR